MGLAGGWHPPGSQANPLVQPGPRPYSCGVQGNRGLEMAVKGNGKTKKMGRVARRVARIERRTLKVMMVPVILIAQRRMMKSLEHMS